MSNSYSEEAYSSSVSYGQEPAEIVLVSSSGNAESSERRAVPASFVGNVSSGYAAYVSAIEESIKREGAPIPSNESEEISVLGERGIWLNKAEVLNWSGSQPISSYAINNDSNPIVLNKRSNQAVEYVQELGVRFLKPPTPQPPGDIVVVEEGGQAAEAAPPVIVRVQPPRASTPESLIVREAPPKPPASFGRTIIRIPGRRLPPPPRRVVIERLGRLPAKPQSILVERWLLRRLPRRRVVFQPAGPDQQVARQRNLVVLWDDVQVRIRKEFRNLGVIQADPSEYLQRYGSTLVSSKNLPDFALNVQPPSGYSLASNINDEVYELEGDLQALRYVDLERAGLSIYRSQLERLGVIARRQ